MNIKTVVIAFAMPVIFLQLGMSSIPLVHQLGFMVIVGVLSIGIVKVLKLR